MYISQVFSFFLVLYIILILYLEMVFYGDIIDTRTYDPIFAKNRRKRLILVLNNEYNNVDDPMLSKAKEVAIRDMERETTYIHPELIDKE